MNGNPAFRALTEFRTAVTAVLAGSAFTAAGGAMYALHHDGFPGLAIGLPLLATGLVMLGSGTVKR
ncbi:MULTISPECIES: hypothetical protein [Streptomyces]|uniref:Integral membrane protein n=1 Tax=Streptomyces spororaveus TaxID=284039 RepID=A0ABQ3T606_9ACTN|nr:MULTISPECIES: hypothetical protein [Streptomyces]MCM9083468.1 hypothetical protein [Streptomyces spororaveus]MCX5301932.1 hypothetical protein [Streptomyces sp. NBC_00160]GHI75817.1 hypothetical protein Sspor_13780 [Streptomyces spororaveus]